MDWIWTDQQFGAGLSQLTASVSRPISLSKVVAFSIVSSRERSFPGRWVMFFISYVFTGYHQQ